MHAVLSSHVHLEAVPQSARELRRAVRESAAIVGFNGQSLFDLLIGTGEAFTNAVRHGSDAANGGIEVRISASRAEIAVSLEYGGESFTHEIPEASELQNGPGGGMGRFLMYELLDHVDYEFKDGCTRVRMLKRNATE